DAAQPLELALGRLRDAMSEARLARAGRAVENDRTEPVGFDRAAEQFSFRQDVSLSNELVEDAGTHSRREGGVAGNWICRSLRALGGCAAIEQVGLHDAGNVTSRLWLVEDEN